MRASLLILSLLLLVPQPASATWTIVALDRKTGEVGSAGASCTPYVAGVAKLVPGKGAIVAQAASNMEAKQVGAELIERGRTAADIVVAIASPTFDRSYQNQQYGVVTLSGASDGRSAAAFTGSATAQHRGHRLDRDVAVQGNILVSSKVLEDVMRAFQRSPAAPLSERLLLALEAGSLAGGDARCPGKTAQSAYLGVARSSDPPSRLTTRIIVTTGAEDRRNPVSLLRARFDQQKRRDRR